MVVARPVGTVEPIGVVDALEVLHTRLDLINQELQYRRPESKDKTRQDTTDNYLD